MDDEERLWTTEEVSTYTGVPVGTLRQWRHRGVGPRSFRVGGRVRYRSSEVHAFVAECEASEDRRLRERGAVAVVANGRNRPPRRAAHAVTTQGKPKGNARASRRKSE